MSCYYEYSDFAKKTFIFAEERDGHRVGSWLPLQGKGAGDLSTAAPGASGGHLRATETLSQQVGSGAAQQGLAQAGVGRQRSGDEGWGGRADGDGDIGMRR